MPDTLNDRAGALAESARALEAEGIRYIQLETPDLNGTLRGKLTTPKKALSPNGSAFCTILYGMSVRDDIYESRHSSFANGFPDACAIADPDTVAVIDRENGVASVICDMFGAEREGLYPISPRTALRRAVDWAGELGFEPRFAIELEMFVVRLDEAAISAGRHHDQLPLGRLHNAYSLARMDELRPIATAFLDRMGEIGIPIDAIHTELGYGALEVAISHLPALQAADACARVRLYLKEFLARRGYGAVFMPKWRIDESGCGGHVHQSLWRDGKPAFADEQGAFSRIGRQYVAGQLASLRDFAAVFYPGINSYRRMDAGTWAPENVSWGVDNRTCALRVITRPGPAAVRVEHRCPGADINPYLAIAAMLSGGLDGIEREVDAPAPVAGNAGEADLPPLPRSLAEALPLFENSELAAASFGPELVEHYLTTRREEQRLWSEWQAQTITEWELSRYFDIH